MNENHNYVSVPGHWSHGGHGLLIFACGEDGWWLYSPFVYGPQDFDQAIQDLVLGLNEGVFLAGGQGFNRATITVVEY